MKKYILFDHDGVLVETEHFRHLLVLPSKQTSAGICVGIDLHHETHISANVNMANGVSAWEAARVSGISESEIKRGREPKELRRFVAGARQVSLIVKPKLNRAQK